MGSLAAGFMSDNRILLRVDYVDGLESYALADDNGEYIGDYYPDGYEFLSAFVSNNRYTHDVAVKLAKRVAFVVSYINPDIPSEVLMRYVDILCREKFDRNGLMINRGMLNKIIEDNQVIRSSVYKNRGYYRFRVGVPFSVRAKAISKNRYLGHYEMMMGYVKNAVDLIMERGDVFVTTSEVIKECEVKMTNPTAIKYLSVMSAYIADYNISVFATDSFQQYLKMCSINKIVDAIDVIMQSKERMSRRNVAYYSGVHFNTVQKLWDSEDIQSVMNSYNELVYS